MSTTEPDLISLPGLYRAGKLDEHIKSLVARRTFLLDKRANTDCQLTIIRMGLEVNDLEYELGYARGFKLGILAALHPDSPNFPAPPPQ